MTPDELDDRGIGMIKRMTMVAAAAIALTGTAGPPGVAEATAGPVRTSADQVTVNGEGQVPVVPDIMYVRSGVELRRPDAAQAYQATADAAARLVKVIIGSGVAEKDVRTMELSVQPEYVPDRHPEISGYRGSESVAATVRDLGRAHETLKAIMGAGADVQLHGVTFDKEDFSAELAAAEKRAFADARSKAGRQAKLLGRKLGRVMSAMSQTVDPIPAHIIPKEMVAASGGHLSPGEGLMRVSVQVVYALA